MVITKTPFRISFFGGGTDYPEFYREHGGSVITTTINKCCYVTARHIPRFFDYSIQLSYSKIENANAVDEIEHPAVRETIRLLDMRDLSVGYDADLPGRTGLGSSSAFVVGMLNAFNAIKGKYADKRKLADDAIYIERTMCAEAGGVQDQIAVSFGGLNRINFSEHGYTVDPIRMRHERREILNDNLMLFFTGISRISAQIAKSQQRSTRNKTAELTEMLTIVDEAERILEDSHADINEFGRLLDRTWQLKKGLTKEISNDSIDEMYRTALRAGALGGKLLGAGGGGFILLYVEKERQQAVRRALAPLLCVPFRFEYDGTRVMYYVPEEYRLND